MPRYITTNYKTIKMKQKQKTIPQAAREKKSKQLTE